MTGPGIGSSSNPVTIGAAESQHFPFRVNAHGTVRLVLDYWVGSTRNPCERGKRMKSMKSFEFSIEWPHSLAYRPQIPDHYIGPSLSRRKCQEHAEAG